MLTANAKFHNPARLFQDPGLLPRSRPHARNENSLTPKLQLHNFPRVHQGQGLLCRSCLRAGHPRLSSRTLLACSHHEPADPQGPVPQPSTSSRSPSQVSLSCRSPSSLSSRTPSACSELADLAFSPLPLKKILHGEHEVICYTTGPVRVIPRIEFLRRRPPRAFSAIFLPKAVSAEEAMCEILKIECSTEQEFMLRLPCLVVEFREMGFHIDDYDDDDDNEYDQRRSSGRSAVSAWPARPLGWSRGSVATPSSRHCHDDRQGSPTFFSPFNCLCLFSLCRHIGRCTRGQVAPLTTTTAVINM